MASSSSSSVEPYPYPSTLNVANFVSIKLSKANYQLWKTQMLCLIESQDFLGFIDGSTRSPAETVTSNKDYLIWRRSDRLLKGWMLGSLSEDVLSTVVGLNTARDVWTKLQNTLGPDSKEQIPSNDEFATSKKEKKGGVEEKDVSYYLPLYKAALRGDWETAKSFFDQDRDAVTAKITLGRKTILHIAVGTGKAIHFVEKLTELIPIDAFAIQDRYGATALSIAVCVGNTKATSIMVNKNPALLYIADIYDDLPLHIAAAYAHTETLSYLLTVTKANVETSSPFADQSGVKLLVRVIVSGLYDIALDLVKRYPNLATVEPDNCDSPLTAIARKADAFPSGTHLNFWESLIYSCVPVKLDNCLKNPNRGDIENPANNSQVLKQTNDHVRFLGGNYICSVLCIKHIRHQKLVHRQALQLVKCLCNEISSLNNQSLSESLYETPVVVAASLGIHEVVEDIVETSPSALSSRDKDNRHTFQLAVINRCEKVFNLLYQMNDQKRFLIALRDNSRNNILHLAGSLAPQHKLNLVSGAALQMQRELQWFKEVEKFASPAYKEELNASNETPAMVFTKEHRNLVIDGEKWMKDTATSCTIAAALIATVVFAGAFTVPGGKNGDNVLPIFSQESAFIIFVVSDALSLFTSTTSLLMFLSILTSRYAEQDFLYVLPKSLIIGLVTLFFSTTSMMIAFSAMFFLVFGHKKAWLIPVAALACLPITLFVTLQFPLLIDLVSSTYGHGIFGKQSDRPFY